MDKSWIDLSNRMSREYKDGINQFMEFTNGFDNEFISCPCRKCANRRDKVSFDGTREYGPAPRTMMGVELLSQLEQEQIRTMYDFQDLLAPLLPSIPCANRRRSHNWKKKSIFYNLPYWKDNLLRHNLDVMDIEKNACDNILWTILGVQGKSNDGVNARRDFKEMGLRKPLHLQLREFNKAHMPPAQYMMSKDEKDVFLFVLKGVNVLDGEALLGGPVQFRWMYPIERYMNTWKRYVRNSARLEASIAKECLMDEYNNFCTAYLNDIIETKLTRPSRINDGPVGEDMPFDLNNIEWIQAPR
ncbi:hypothetical protein AAC387_Pa12g1265 [Persea americana]